MAMTKKMLPEEHPYFHSTWKLLKNYRDVSWQLEVSGLDLQAEFRAEYGSAADRALDTVEAAGADLQGTHIESFARSLDRSRKMLHLIDSAIELVRRKHKKGELYYWVLYYTFLSPQKYNNAEEILQALAAHFPSMALRTYYVKREEAIEVVSSVLWGYTSQECRSILASYEESMDARL